MEFEDIIATACLCVVALGVIILLTVYIFTPSYPYMYESYSIQVNDTSYNFGRCDLEKTIEGDFTIYEVQNHCSVECRHTPNKTTILKFKTTDIVAERYEKNEHH